MIWLGLLDLIPACLFHCATCLSSPQAVFPTYPEKGREPKGYNELS